LVPQTSIGELSSTFYAEFRYAYKIFLLGTVSKIQKNVNVQNSTLHANETGRNFSPKCIGILLSSVFGARYIPLQHPAIFCQHSVAFPALYITSHPLYTRWSSMGLMNYEYYSEVKPKAPCPVSTCDGKSARWTYAYKMVRYL
jgi:hypothetical protein